MPKLRTALRDNNSTSTDAGVTGAPHRPGIYDLPEGFPSSIWGPSILWPHRLHIITVGNVLVLDANGCELPLAKRGSDGTQSIRSRGPRPCFQPSIAATEAKAPPGGKRGSLLEKRRVGDLSAS